MKTLEEAQKELNEFLEQHPELEDYQKEIERIMDNSLPEQRLEILGDMISERLITLKEKCQELSSILTERI